MKFILPTGESQKLTVEFIASNLKIEYSKAADKERQFEKLLDGKLKTSGEITFSGLTKMIIDNQAKYGTPVWSSYDFPEEVYSAEREIDKCIDELIVLLYYSFPKYFDNEIKPSIDSLSAYLETPISYEFLDEAGESLVTKNKWHSNIELNHLQLSFSVDEDFLEADNDARKRKYTDIRRKLSKIGVASFIEIDRYTKDYPCQFVIPWFYVPILNKNLKKLGYDVVAKNKKEKSASIDSFSIDSLLEDLKKHTSISNDSYTYSHSSFFSKKAQDISKIKSHQTILNQFALLGFFNGYENKLKVSDSLNIIGKTCIEFPSNFSFEEIGKITDELKSIGLKCEAESFVGLPNSIKISLKVDDLEAWITEKIAEKDKIFKFKEPQAYQTTPDNKSLSFFGCQGEKSVSTSGIENIHNLGNTLYPNEDSSKDTRQGYATVYQSPHY